MQRFSKLLLASAAALALTSGAMAFSTSEASAQLSINLGNLGGLIPHGNYYGPRYRSRRGRTQHEVRHERRSKDKDAKGDDSGNGNSADNGNNKPDRVQLSGHTPETAASGPPPANASPPPVAAPSHQPAQPSGDLPTLTPER